MDWRENMNRSKEVLGAYFRQGLRELGAALHGPGTAAQPPEYGMISTKLPGEILQDLRADAGEPKAPDGETGRSVLDSYLQDARARAPEPEPEREAPEPERH